MNDIPTLTISDDITKATVMQVADLYNKAVKDGVGEAIIYINSPGGCVRSCNSITAFLTAGPVKFHVAALGEASSAALVILAHGSVRYAAEACVLMFHECWFRTMGKVDEVGEIAARIAKENRSLIERFAARTRMPVDWWVKQAKKRETRDFYFSSAEALKYGVIDKIGVPKIVTVRRVV